MSKGRILIVDDEIDIVRSISLRLRANGYEVVFANDGVEAIQVALLTSPDLLILDVGLPRGDGFTIAQKLLEDSKTREIPSSF